MFSGTGISADEASQSWNGIFATNGATIHGPGWHSDRADGSNIATATSTTIGSSDTGGNGDSIGVLLMMKTSFTGIRHWQGQLKRSAEYRNRERNGRITG